MRVAERRMLLVMTVKGLALGFQLAAKTARQGGEDTGKHRNRRAAVGIGQRRAAQPHGTRLAMQGGVGLKPAQCRFTPNFPRTALRVAWGGAIIKQ